MSTTTEVGKLLEALEWLAKNGDMTARVTAKTALAAWSQRRPLREDAELMQLMRRAITTNDLNLARTLDAIEARALGPSGTPLAGPARPSWCWGQSWCDGNPCTCRDDDPAYAPAAAPVVGAPTTMQPGQQCVRLAGHSTDERRHEYDDRSQACWDIGHFRGARCSYVESAPVAPPTMEPATGQRWRFHGGGSLDGRYFTINERWPANGFVVTWDDGHRSVWPSQAGMVKECTFVTWTDGYGPAAAVPVATTPPQTVEGLLGALRADGWMVAVHNDYRQDGQAKTFWLFTRGDRRWIKGEADDDLSALMDAWHDSQRPDVRAGLLAAKLEADREVIRLRMQLDAAPPAGDRGRDIVEAVVKTKCPRHGSGPCGVASGPDDQAVVGAFCRARIQAAVGAGS